MGLRTTGTLVGPPVVAGGLVIPMLPHSSLVLGVSPLGTGLPLRKNAAASGSLSVPSGPLSAPCHKEGASPASPECPLLETGELGLVEGWKKLEEVQDGEEVLRSSFLCLDS